MQRVTILPLVVHVEIESKRLLLSSRKAFLFGIVGIPDSAKSVAK
jgi:hypothetical protein